MLGASLTGFTVSVKSVESEYSPSETIAVIIELPFQFKLDVKKIRLSDTVTVIAVVSEKAE